MQYSISRNVNGSSHYVLYDMGAGTTTATVVQFATIQAPGERFSRAVPMVQVKASSSVPHGGSDMDIILQKHIAEKFQLDKRVKSSVFQNERAMLKILREAKRVKEVLTINQNAVAAV